MSDNDYKAKNWERATAIERAEAPLLKRIAVLEAKLAKYEDKPDTAKRFGTHTLMQPHSGCSDTEHCDCECALCMSKWRLGGKPGSMKGEGVLV